MRNYRTADPEDERKYSEFITSEHRDDIINSILKASKGNKEVHFEYEDIPNPPISEQQFEIIIEGLLERGLLKKIGYDDYLIKDGLHILKEKGGFSAELDLFKRNIELIYQNLDEEEKSKLQEFFKKANPALESASNVVEIAKAIFSVSSLLL